MIQPNPAFGRVVPYAPGEQGGGGEVIKLNTNEFPYPAAPEVLEAIRREATDAIRLYPSPRCDRLRERLAERHQLGVENVFVGNGSDEVLRLAIQAYGGPGRMVATVGPSYSLYPTLVELTGGDLQVFNLDDIVRLPESLFEAAWDLLLLPVPNAPVGTVFGDDKVLSLAGKPGLLLLDEAYIDFADNINHISLISEKGNVLLCRTFSKSYGLAGLRVGYALGPPRIIDTLSAIADVYNVNRISQGAAEAALEAGDYYRGRIEQIKADRAWLTGQLRARGFEVPQSHANFLFARREGAARLHRDLQSRGILVRYFPTEGLEDGIRISIGTREELEALLAGIDELSSAEAGDAAPR